MSKRPVVIGVAGGTGSGKTTVALRVQEAAPGKTVQIIHHDSYYRDNSHLSLKVSMPFLSVGIMSLLMSLLTPPIVFIA